MIYSSPIVQVYLVWEMHLVDLYIYGKEKKLLKKIAKMGYAVVDVIFPK